MDMKKDSDRCWAAAGMASILVMAGACSSGGGGGTAAVGALSVPAQVTLVDAQGAPSTLLAGAQAAVADELGRRIAQARAFDTDTADFWVRDDSMEALNTVNVILCSVQQTGYDDPDVLNAGPYAALVECEERGSSGGGQGRGGDVPEYQRFVVDSQRASATAPHIVHCWLEQVEEGQPALIYVKLTITESPTTNAPYGAFELHFKSLLVSQAHDDTNVRFHGVLKTVPRNDGRAEFVFYQNGGDVDATQTVGQQSFRQRARLVASADGREGQAYSETRSAYNNGGGTMTQGAEYFLQYNQDYLARKRVSGSQTTEVFDRNDFNTRVYNYGVYTNDSSGDFVARRSGFGLETQGGDYGWIGYHGLWFPDNVTITDGQTLIRRSFEPNSTPTEYTAVVVPGRLEKNERTAITLADIKNEDLEFFDPMTGSQIMIQWDGTNLMKVAERPNDSWIDLDPHVNVSGDFSSGDWLDFYSRHRGSVQMLWPASPSDASVAYVWSNVTIDGSSSEIANSNLTLHGYFGMLKPLLTSNQANFQSSETPFYPDATSTSVGNKTYTFNRTSLMLEESSQEVRLANGVEITQGPGQFGLRCGPLFPTALTVLSDVSTQTTQYFWTVGGETWNQLRTVVDSNDDNIQFDRPLLLSYTHDEPTSAYHGRSFILEWDGNNLHGVPYNEVPGKNYWEPAFNIPNGAVVTDLQTSTQYKIKQLEGEQSMTSVSSPSTVIASEGFDLDTTLTPPTDTYQDPAIGAIPTVTEPPKFVAGEKQTSDD